MPALDAEAIHAFLDELAPGSTESFVIESVEARTARVRMPFTAERSRPGGSIGGPVLMTLADTALWVALIGAKGRITQWATVNLNIHFLAPAPPADVVAEARLHRVGKRLATGDVLMYSVGTDGDPVAHATGTYSYRP